jgi:hypothetical protein
MEDDDDEEEDEIELLFINIMSGAGTVKEVVARLLLVR